MKKFWEYTRKAYTWVFCDIDGTFSMRKLLAIVAAFLFLYAGLHYIHTHTDDLPETYHTTIKGVFAFYFLKKTLEGLKDINITRKNQNGDN